MPQILNSLPARGAAALEKTCAFLIRELGENLHSLSLYGSAMRGDFNPSRSDLNLLIVLHSSDGTAHRKIRGRPVTRPRVDPMVISLESLERTTHIFALKFSSIQRHYSVLHGSDPFGSMTIDDNLLRFLVEQELRNLRMRLVHFYVMSSDRRYAEYVQVSVARILVTLADAARCSGRDLPTDIVARMPIFAELFDIDETVLRELIQLKSAPATTALHRAEHVHDRLVLVLDQVIHWLEDTWPSQRL
jgi:hypothetical protein